MTLSDGRARNRCSIQFGCYYRDGLRRLAVLQALRRPGESTTKAVQRVARQWVRKSSRFGVKSFDFHVHHGPIIRF